MAVEREKPETIFILSPGSKKDIASEATDQGRTGGLL